MGRADHVPAELLSALADGELDLSAARKIQDHVAVCGECSGQLAAFTRLDLTLSAPATLGCAEARELRSGLMDRELSDGESRVAAQHLSVCEACRRDQAAWTLADQAIRAMPAAIPSAAIDARVARLTAPEDRPRLVGPAFGGLALRGAVAAALVLAILAGLLPGAPGGPEQAQQPPGEQVAVVAGVQQAVLYSATNTLYVLQTADAAVDAMDASTYVLRTRIAVGGRPTALALNEAASRVLVLDESQRSLVEIDAERNAVVSSTQIPVSGTPTSVRVEPGTGKIIVSAIADQPASGGPGPTPTIGTTAGPGVVVVLDGTTKKLETITSLEVAPRVVVADPSGKRSLLVSGGASTLVDGSYKTLRTLPGGVAAAFAPRGDMVAVLAAESATTAVLTFNGDGAPGPLRLAGVPLAVTSIPEVGFAVLLGSGSGNGRIVVVDEAGHAVGVSDVDQVGRDLAFDTSSRKFTVVGGGKVTSAALPAGILPAQAVRKPDQSAAPATPPPSVIAPLRMATPSASASPSAPPSAPAAVEPVRPVALPVPSSARRIDDGLYHADLGGRVARMSAAGPRSVWFIDQSGRLQRLDTESGALLTFDGFPKQATITALAVGTRAVYAADAANRVLYTLAFGDERVTSQPAPFLSTPTVMLVALDGRIWASLSGSGQILVLDPEKHRSEFISTGLASVSTLAFDEEGRAWFTDGAKVVGTYDPRTVILTLYSHAGSGDAQKVLPDGAGRVWVTSSTGEITVIERGMSRLALNVRRPVTSLARDPLGDVWFLAPAAPGMSGSTLGRADGSELEALPGPATDLAFNSAGRAWLADPAGGFYLRVEGAR